MAPADNYPALGPNGELDYKKLLVGADGRLLTDATSSGLKESIRVTTMVVTDVAAPLPAVALANRNSLSIDTIDDEPGYDAEKIFVGPATVTADRVIGVTSGKEVLPAETYSLDITDDIVLYGVAAAGKNVLIKITELA